MNSFNSFRLDRATCIALLLVFAPRAGLAQDASAARTNAPPRFNPPVYSPDVHLDRTVTFRVRAPAAREVTVSGEWGSEAKQLTRDDQGIWSVTVGPLEPNLYGYAFNIDGFRTARTADPGNPNLKPMRSPTTSILDVPGPTPALHDFQADVPHGAVCQHWYQSQALDRRRALNVYTPPGYEKNTRTRYPVLYLFHGSGDKEATWTALGRAQCISDNLLSQDKMKPMIIVMTDGHAALPRVTGAVSSNMIAQNVRDFERDLLTDVMPFVESNYRVRSGSANRAIVGLSMGGGQSLTIGLNHPELFAWVGGFSSFIQSPEAALPTALSDPKGTNRRLKLLWLACGKEDRLIDEARKLSTLLKDKGIRHEYVETEGDHSWPVWRRYLADFMPLLFAGKARK